MNKREQQSLPQYCTADDMEKHILRDEIERLTRALHYEQHWLSRIGTHGPGCWSWGPAHYECAVKEIKDAEKNSKEWQQKPLTDVAIGDIYMQWDATPGVSHADFARAIERAHGIGGKSDGRQALLGGRSDTIER